jgi:hypothetical protein
VDAAVVEPRLNGGIDHAVLGKKGLAGELGSGDAGPQVIATPLVDHLDLGARQGDADHVLELGEISHTARIPAVAFRGPGRDTPATMKRLLTLLTLSGAVVIPASAHAAIVPQHGIDGVKLGQTAKKVRQIAGKPVRVVRGSNEIGSYTEYRYRGLTVNFFGGPRVTAVSTRSRTQRTAGGIGVGSTEAELATAIPAVTCETFGAFRSCTLGTQEPGRRVTAFDLRNGKVSRVLVSFVID